jgi:hypothetical protein
MQFNSLLKNINLIIGNAYDFLNILYGLPSVLPRMLLQRRSDDLLPPMSATKQTPWPLVRKRTIKTKRRPLDEI